MNTQFPEPIPNPAREAALSARIDAWLAHMTWRPNYASWRAGRIWQERDQADRLATIARYAGVLPGRRILDLGAGMGGTSVALALAGAQVRACEYNPAYCEIIRLRAARYGLDLPVFNGAAEAIPLPDASVDAAICWDVVEHVQDPDRLLAELARVIVPGGALLITVINRYAFRDPHYHLPLLNWLPRPFAEAVIAVQGRSKRGVAFRDMQRLSDMHYYTIGAFRELAASHGFSLIDIGEARLHDGERRATGTKGRIRDLFVSLGLDSSAYNIYRTLFQGTFELALTRSD